MLNFFSSKLLVIFSRVWMESNTRRQFKRICVFCGSNPGHRKVFSDAAVELGNELVGLVCFSQTNNLCVDWQLLWLRSFFQSLSLFCQNCVNSSIGFFNVLDKVSFLVIKKGLFEFWVVFRIFETLHIFVVFL